MRSDNEAMIALARRSGMEVEAVPDARLAVAHLDLRPRPPEVRLFLTRAFAGGSGSECRRGAREGRPNSRFCAC
jgi:hypothetical protein